MVNNVIRINELKRTAYSPDFSKKHTHITPSTPILPDAINMLANVVLLGVVSVLPNGHVTGCMEGSKGLPFCNASLSVGDRVKDLVARMTTDEKVSMMAPSALPGGADACAFKDIGVPRFGIPPYLHLVEMNTNVASCCLKEGQCATTYAGPTGLGAAFNTTMWRMKGELISDEFRAMNNIGWHRCVGASDVKQAPIGLTGFGPNINIMRDPRWGRNSEVPSEDPFLAGEYAHHYVRGGQTGEDMRYTKVAMSLKHFAAYSVEANRFAFAPNISMHDLWETFLPQFQRGMDVDGGNATGVMCSYDAPNGVPACANKYLLNDVLRGDFNRSDAVVGTDCGAVQNMVLHNHYSKTDYDAARDTLFGGSDLEFGDTYWTPISEDGKGLLQEIVEKEKAEALAAIDASLTRILTVRFKTGQFDDLADQPYTKIGAEVVNSTEHQKINLDSTLQSLVLLKNNDTTLPIKAQGAEKISLALVGPHVDAQLDLLSDYHGDQICFDGTYNCIPTIRAVFSDSIPKDYSFVQSVAVEKGVDINSKTTSGIAAAVHAAALSNVTVFFGGLGHVMEHEGIDRTSVTLPGQQGELLDQILALPNKPRVVIVLINGGAVSLGADTISKADAIVEAFYPSIRGAEALYKTLFGASNAWGRMPYTIMKASTVAALDMNNFDMAKAPGRTYKYLSEEAEFEFGHGLSYTTFNVTGCTADNVVATNTGAVAGDAVVMLFHRPGDDVREAVGGKHPVPLKTLIGFDRAALGPGASATLTLTGQRYESLDESLKLVDENGVRTQYPGTHYLDFFDGVNTCTFVYTN